MHYFQHNIADYRKDTIHLSLLEHGIYRQLLDTYYLSELPLPKDLNVLYRLITARSNDEIQATQNVLNDFFTETEVGFIHKRCQSEIEQYHLKSEKASSSAKKRWNDANAMPTHSERNANSQTNKLINPLTNKLINPLNNKHTLTTMGVDDGFLEFWDMYPKKVGKGAALKAWEKTKPDITKVLNALAWQIKSDQWFKNGGQFIPNPATYLNQSRWEDEPSVPQTF